MSSISPKNALYATFAAVARVIANEHRLDLIEHLAQGERAVEDLAGRCGLSVANASQHLQQMLQAGLVVVRRDGKRRLYSLASDAVVVLVDSLRTVAEAHHAASRQMIRDYFEARDGLEPVGREDLLARVAEGSVTLLDVRPADEFSQAHLPGAINLPLKELESRLAEIDPATEIVAYCRGPFCVLSFEAVRLLRDQGYKVRRLADGLPEWRAAGLPVERAAP
jgi:ArsR family transcriptional regulator